MKRLAQIVVGVGKAVQDVGCEVTNYDTNHVIHHTCRCSEQNITGPKTTRQSYAICPVRSFDTAVSIVQACCCLHN